MDLGRTYTMEQFETFQILCANIQYTAGLCLHLSLDVSAGPVGIQTSSVLHLPGHSGYSANNRSLAQSSHTHPVARLSTSKAGLPRHLL